MAGILAIAQTGEVALTAATGKTVVQITAPANHRVLVKRWGVFFDGTAPLNEPVQVTLKTQSSAGTMSSLTINKITPGSEIVQTTALQNATVEPTGVAVLDVAEVHPQSGYEVIFPLGQEVILEGGQRIGIFVTAPQAVNCRSKIIFEE